MRIRWRGLELPTRVLPDRSVSTPTYGRFMVEPFERGFGTTVGNSLRRVLLSSLEGAAVTHVKIKGAEHEFSSLTGVLEDVTEIILNIKSLVVKSTSDEPKTMKLAIQGKAGQHVEIRASEIIADPALEIVNPDHLLATLTDAVDFELEMTVKRGRGYVTAEENKPQGEDQIIGIISVDSVFSPVTRVRYRVEDTRVGQRTNYDRLILEVWTNGTVSPEMGLVEAAKILRKHLNPFVQYTELGSGLAVEGSSGEFSQEGSGMAGMDQSKMSIPIASLDLSVRASNCLSTASIKTIGDLMKYDEQSLLQLRSFGKTSLREVKRKLTDLGLTLRSSGKSVDDDYDDDDETDEEMNQMPTKVTPSAPSFPPLDSGTMHNTPPRPYPPTSNSNDTASAPQSNQVGFVGGDGN